MYCAKLIDLLNSFITGKMFDNKEDAVEFALKNYINIDDKSETVSRSEGYYWVNERNGKLYEHDSEYKETYDEDDEFSFDFDDYSTTVSGLRKFLSDGKFLEMYDEGDGAGVKVSFVNPYFHGYQVLDEMKDTDEYDNFNCDSFLDVNQEDSPVEFKEDEFEFLHKNNNIYVGFWTEKEVDLSNVREHLLEHNLINAADKPEMIEETQFMWEEGYQDA